MDYSLPHTPSPSLEIMQDQTSLSPRLRHLLIQEDRNTGRLLVPRAQDSRSSPDNDNSLGISVQSTSSHGSSILLSPPISPTTFAFAPMPIHNHAQLPLPSTTGTPRILPRTTGRKTSSIFSLLNDAPTGLAHHPSPPSSTPSIQVRRPVSEEQRKSPTYLSIAPAPRTAPLPSLDHEDGDYFDRQIGGAPLHSHPQPYSPLSSSHYHTYDDRPSLSRRHSSHPYGFDRNPSSLAASRPATAYAYQEGEYTASSGLASLGMGARAPISRTTKACNACRSRKVRCDAGANNGGGSVGEPSMCSRCKESGVQCIYTGVQKKRGPCPGTARPATGTKGRRPNTSQQTNYPPGTPSHRSSIASVHSYVVTPTEEQPWSTPTQASYDFPLPTSLSPTEWSSVAPCKSKSSRNLPSATAIYTAGGAGVGTGHAINNIVSWPGSTSMDVDVDRDLDQGQGQRKEYDYIDRIRKYDHHTSSSSSSSSTSTCRTLPPLRVAINPKKTSYFES